MLWGMSGLWGPADGVKVKVLKCVLSELIIQCSKHSASHNFWSQKSIV